MLTATGLREFHHSQNGIVTSGLFESNIAVPFWFSGLQLAFVVVEEEATFATVGFCLGVTNRGDEIICVSASSPRVIDRMGMQV